MLFYSQVSLTDTISRELHVTILENSSNFGRRLQIFIWSNFRPFIVFSSLKCITLTELFTGEVEKSKSLVTNSKLSHGKSSLMTDGGAVYVPVLNAAPPGAVSCGTTSVTAPVSSVGAV